MKAERATEQGRKHARRVKAFGPVIKALIAYNQVIFSSELCLVALDLEIEGGWT